MVHIFPRVTYSGQLVTHWHLSIIELCWMEGTSGCLQSNFLRAAVVLGQAVLGCVQSVWNIYKDGDQHLPWAHSTVSSLFLPTLYLARIFGVRSITSCFGLVASGKSLVLPLLHSPNRLLQMVPPEPCLQNEKIQPSPPFPSSCAPDSNCLGDLFHGPTPACHCLSCAEHRTAQTAQDVIVLEPNRRE